MKVFSAGSRFAQRGLVSHWIPQNWCATSHLLAERSGARCDLVFVPRPESVTLTREQYEQFISNAAARSLGVPC
jgi:hypothetical protein